MRPARTILAVLLGYLSLLAVDFLGALAFRGIIALETLTFVAGAVGGAVTGRVANVRPVLHAIVLGAVIICVGFLAAAFSTRPLPAGVPSWYPYASALLTGAGVFVGGALTSREKPSSER